MTENAVTDSTWRRERPSRHQGVSAKCTYAMVAINCARLRAWGSLTGVETPSGWFVASSVDDQRTHRHRREVVLIL